MHWRLWQMDRLNPSSYYSFSFIIWGQPIIFPEVAFDCTLSVAICFKDIQKNFVPLLQSSIDLTEFEVYHRVSAGPLKPKY